MLGLGDRFFLFGGDGHDWSCLKVYDAMLASVWKRVQAVCMSIYLSIDGNGHDLGLDSSGIDFEMNLRNDILQ